MSARRAHPMPADDPVLAAAYAAAGETFGYFWREMSWEARRIIPGLEVAAVKFAFSDRVADGSDAVEHMWATDIGFDGEQVTGVLMNDPIDLRSIAAGDPVVGTRAEIEDWMFTIGGVVHGGHTIQAMRAGMGRWERRRHDKAWGLRFPPVGTVLLAHEQDRHPERLVEHPMCVNMADSMLEFLAEHPDEATTQDENGLQLLHREAIAGNLGCVRALIEHGVPIDQRTASGRTALDYAESMGWEHVATYLRRATG